MKICDNCKRIMVLIDYTLDIESGDLNRIIKEYYCLKCESTHTVIIPEEK